MGFAIPLVAAAFPETAAAIGLGGATAGSIASASSTLGLVSSGIGAVGSIMQSSAQSKAAKANAQISQNNAQIATQNANFAGAEGEANAAQTELKTRAAVGQQLSSEAANGVDVNSGSAVSVRASEQQLGQLDAMQIRSNAARTAYGYQTEAQGEMSQAELDKAGAEGDTTAGFINAGSTLLGGVSNAGFKYANYLKNGGLNGTF